MEALNFERKMTQTKKTLLLSFILILAACSSPNPMIDIEPEIHSFSNKPLPENQTMKELEKQSILSKIFMIDDQIHHVETQIEDARRQALEHQMFPTPENVSMASSMQTKINDLEVRKAALLHQKNLLKQRNKTL